MEKAHLGDDHLNQNHIGMVEQTICANAHTFVGMHTTYLPIYLPTYLSTYRNMPHLPIPH